jgi:hypothetical protein
MILMQPGFCNAGINESIALFPVTAREFNRLPSDSLSLAFEMTSAILPDFFGDLLPKPCLSNLARSIARQRCLPKTPPNRASSIPTFFTPNTSALIDGT